MKRFYSRNFILNVWAEQPFWRFMALVISATLAITLLFALVFHMAGPIKNLSAANLPLISEKPFVPCLKRSFVVLVTLDTDTVGCRVSPSWLDDLLVAVEILFGVFFFASIVAFFTGVVLRPKEVFQLKDCLNIRVINGARRVVFSYFNNSPTTVGNLRVRIVARARVNKKTMRNVVLHDGPPVHPLAEPYIPLRSSGSLSENDVAIAKIKEDGFVIQIDTQRVGDEKPLVVEEIYADVSGIMVGIEQSVHASKRYIIKEQGLFFGLFKSVDPDYDYARQKGITTRLKPPKEVIEKFHHNENSMTFSTGKIYVFGYGSLLDPKSFSNTLQRKDWVAEDFPLAKLIGYRRTWNVAMDNSQTIPGYKRYALAKNTSEFPKVFVTFLNIEKANNCDVIGVITEVNEDELDRLRKRERNYVELDVTDAMEQGPSDGRVLTFIGSQEAHQRFEHGVEQGSTVINQNYKDGVDRAYRTRGRVAHDNYVHHTVEPSQTKEMNLVRRST